MEPQLILICFKCFGVQEGYGREDDGISCPNCLEGPLAACVAVPVEMVEERSGDYIKAAAIRAIQAVE